MKSATLVGLLLIVLGIGALVYQGISYKSQEKILDIGSIEATAVTTKTIPISPIVGVIAVVSGVAVVIATARHGATSA
jgi:uncharacterized membrane protein YidH (DUF202 family)